MIGTLEEHLIDEYEGQGITPERTALRISDEARRMAADPRFKHLADKPLEWWQALIDQEERYAADSAHMRRSL